MENHVIYQTDTHTVSLLLEVVDSVVVEVLSCEVIPALQAPAYRGKRSGRGLTLTEDDEAQEAQMPYLVAERGVSVETVPAVVE